jgi:predicted DNA-binding transcriptional regulator YafY
LIDRPGVAVDEAARDLDCTVRTIWRDLRVLQDAGFPIFDEPEPKGGDLVWRVDDTFKQRLPLKLSLAELAALLMSRDLLAPTAAGGLGPAVTSAFEKIGASSARTPSA